MDEVETLDSLLKDKIRRRRQSKKTMYLKRTRFQETPTRKTPDTTLKKRMILILMVKRKEKVMETLKWENYLLTLSKILSLGQNRLTKKWRLAFPCNQCNKEYTYEGALKQDTYFKHNPLAAKVDPEKDFQECLKWNLCQVEKKSEWKKIHCTLNHNT